MLKELISHERILGRVNFLAHAIQQDYEGKDLVAVVVLAGAYKFATELLRRIDLPLRVEYTRISSYGDAQESSGELKMTLDVTGSLSGKDVLLIEDIVDTGLTANKLKVYLETKGAKSIRMASLLHRPGKDLHNTEIHYLGFRIEDEFVVGYGLDYAQRYRELNYIGYFND